MKFWRLNAQEHNAKRAELLALNATLARAQRLTDPGSARVHKERTLRINKVLDRGTRSNGLLAGLLGQLDWGSIYDTLGRHELLSSRQILARRLRGETPFAVL